MGRNVMWAAPAPPDELLQCGQAHQAWGEIRDALACYDAALAHFKTQHSVDPELRRAHGVAWMNRGNALQHLALAGDQGETCSCTTNTLKSVDESSPTEAVKAAGSAPKESRCLDAAVAAYDRAIALFRTLPHEAVPAFRNHLGAAFINRGHALLLGTTPIDRAEAGRSFEQALSFLSDLPFPKTPLTASTWPARGPISPTPKPRARP